MDLATALSIVQTILTAIQTLVQLQSLFSFSDCTRELEDLQSTVKTIQSIFLDAEEKQDALTNQEKDYIQDLNDAVYDANDVIDEFLTLIKQRKQSIDTADDKFSNKVRSFLSRFKFVTRGLTSKVKEVNKKLDGIASKSSKFCFKIDSKAVRFRKEETSSILSSDDEIIGRAEDVEKIVAMLLDSGDVNQPDVSFAAVVGIGGLGKTALAQLIYNDPRITDALFPSRSWICIADQDQEHWDLKRLLAKVVGELSISNNATSLEQMHKEIKNYLGGKKYLLVLDDLWTEDYLTLLEFKKYLTVGLKGSRIILTTRSYETAQIVADQVHELQGLPEEESWHLFERMTFLPKQRGSPLDDDFIELGKVIVKTCANVPLAIREVGCFLLGEPKVEWLSFQKKGLSNMSEGDDKLGHDKLSHILKLSYHQLDSSLKSCFVYCALFPKSDSINKQMLIRLWMAQGYVKDEYVGEKYFRKLVQRCFFQNQRDEIELFKIHDLLHDLAEQVAGQEICRWDVKTLNVSNKVRHLSLLNGYCTPDVFSKTHIRTLLIDGLPRYRSRADQLLEAKTMEKWTCLRSLDLRGSSATTLPESISKLFRLRYLNLSLNKMLAELPKSFTKLVNLQTLDLRESGLKKLPEDLSRLVDLSILNLRGCNNLSHMPMGLDLLSDLHTLGLFVVGQANANANHFDGLKCLRSLNNLKGFLEIRINANYDETYVKEDHGGEKYLITKEGLKRVYINFGKIGSMKYDDMLLEDLQPHHDLKELRLSWYNGETIPSWPKADDKSMTFHLPNLLSLEVINCPRLRCLLPMSKLLRLKKLTLESLENVEYLVNDKLEGCNSCDGSSLLFLSLEELHISELPNLKGWWSRSECGMSNDNKDLVCDSTICFPKLKELVIDKCPKLTSIPICPILE